MWRPYRPLTVQCHEDYRGDREAGPARPFSLNPGPHSDAGWGRWQFGVYARLHEAPVALWPLEQFAFESYIRTPRELLADVSRRLAEAYEQ